MDEWMDGWMQFCLQCALNFQYLQNSNKNKSIFPVEGYNKNFNHFYEDIYKKILSISRWF